MPIMTIDELFIHDGLDLSTYMKFRWRPGEGVDTGEGDTFLSAAGLAITVDSPGAITSLTWQIPGVTLTELAYLRSYRGKFTLIRDSRGNREYGKYLALPWTPWRNPRIADVTINFIAVSYDDTV